MPLAVWIFRELFGLSYVFFFQNVSCHMEGGTCRKCTCGPATLSSVWAWMSRNPRDCGWGCAAVEDDEVSSLAIFFHFSHFLFFLVFHFFSFFSFFFIFFISFDFFLFFVFFFRFWQMMHMNWNVMDSSRNRKRMSRS